MNYKTNVNIAHKGGKEKKTPYSKLKTGFSSFSPPSPVFFPSLWLNILRSFENPFVFAECILGLEDSQPGEVLIAFKDPLLR